MANQDLKRETDRLAAIITGEELPSNRPSLSKDTGADDIALSASSSSLYNDLSIYCQPRTHRQLSESSNTSSILSSFRSIASRTSSISTAPSTAPTAYSAVPSLNHIINNMVPHKIYPCLLRDVLDCDVDFDDEDEWYEHNASHYHGASLPQHAYCIFCDNEYTSSGKDDDYCWKQRMSHIAEHFRDGSLLERSRPDFEALKELYAQGGIRHDVFEFATKYTERPYVDGLIFCTGDLPPEVTARQKQVTEDDSRVTIDVASSKRRHVGRTSRLPSSKHKVYLIASKE